MDSVAVPPISFLPPKNWKNKCQEKLPCAGEKEQEPAWLSHYLPFWKRPHHILDKTSHVLLGGTASYHRERQATFLWLVLIVKSWCQCWAFLVERSKESLKWRGSTFKKEHAYPVGNWDGKIQPIDECLIPGCSREYSHFSASGCNQQTGHCPKTQGIFCVCFRC